MTMLSRTGRGPGMAPRHRTASRCLAGCGRPRELGDPHWRTWGGGIHVLHAISGL